MTQHEEPEVLVVGAGPVGLVAALFLRSHDLRVEVVDQDQRTSQHSYALALHPRTLDLLDELGLAKGLVQRGRALTRIGFYEGAKRRAEIDFSKLPGKHPFVLLERQSALERGLEEELLRRKVKVLWNHRLESLGREGNRTRVGIAKLDRMAMGYPIQRSEWVVVKTLEQRPQFVLGADGHDSAVRRMSGIETSDLGEGVLVSVFEIEAEGELPDEARAVLDADSTSFYWPLEPGRCRFGFTIRGVSEHEPSLARLASFLSSRAPWFDARPKILYWSTAALFDRRLARKFGNEGAWLLGDAAHLATPVGVHSMNVGMKEARALATAIAAVLRGGAPLSSLLEYEAAAREEWELLFGTKPIEAAPGTDPWVEKNRFRILASLPASGEDLAPLLGQIGLVPRT